MVKKYGLCAKCGTKWSTGEIWNDTWLCHANNCLQEEKEKVDGKIELDIEKLEQYRSLVAGTKSIPPSTY